jgi:peptidoglycan lytic transglycosylase G
MRAFVVTLLVVLLAASAAVYIEYSRVHAPFGGFSGSEQFVDIPAGAGTKAIGERLVAGGVVRDEVTFRIALWMSGEARRLKAGEYRFDHPLTPLDVIAKLARGDVYVVAVTFPEGLTIGEMAKIFEAHGFGPRASFTAVAADPSLVRDIDPSARDLEGYLFPDTYLLSRHTDAAHLVKLMVERFQKALAPDIVEAARARGLSVRQVVTLASIVEKETARPEERALVAAVYSNRLRIGMLLQCDPTVIYALMKAGTYDGNIRRDDLAVESPYNTYRVPGLPPGPIASPGKESLAAAAHPAASDYLYFVSRNDGSHEFSRTLEEHNRNVQKFQVQYFRHHPT